MNQKQTKAAVEAMLFAAGDPVSADKLAAAVQLPQTAVETALEDLRARYAREDSGLCLLHLDTRWQLATKTEWADCVRRLLDARRSVPLGPAAMETLTVIASISPSPAPSSSRCAAWIPRPASAAFCRRDSLRRRAALICPATR